MDVPVELQVVFSGIREWKIAALCQVVRGLELGKLVWRREALGCGGEGGKETTFAGWMRSVRTISSEFFPSQDCLRLW